MSLCLVALGSNVGDRQQALARSVAQLDALEGCQVRACSSWHETVAVGGPPGQTPFLNGAVVLETSQPPAQLLGILNEIEAMLGRTRDVRWGPRTVDLDMLLYDELILDSAQLTLPHPRMAFRKFVIEPAAEIAGEWRHPTIGWTLKKLRDHLRHATPYVAITGAPLAGNSQLAARLAESFDARLIRDAGTVVQPSQPAADSAGRRLQAEIESIIRRRQLLDRESWEQPERLAISDFWLEQSRAYGGILDARESATLAGAVDEACRGVIRPKLLIQLGATAPHGRGATSGAAENVDATMHEAIVAVATRPGVGPLLRLTDSESEVQLAEAKAAILAMS
ncbi:MAG TPA: 2-amino-4-hydroxy-6-hydroxymethyldihydropteridine diphosphokinase [Pirellulales bacterium]|jgi:2-amino-4-hydroxy-6-hydroxymethyldihydropteridine diphosphokinase